VASNGITSISNSMKTVHWVISHSYHSTNRPFYPEQLSRHRKMDEDIEIPLKPLADMLP
jgi:hypothetical protein